MTDNHPITPPPELVQQWHNEAMKGFRDNGIYEHDVATQAARWGADQELEACCEWLVGDRLSVTASRLRTARRPKPLSLGEIKLTSGDEIIRITPEGFHYRGQPIEDAGEAHYLLVEFLRRAMPETDWKHAND